MPQGGKTVVPSDGDGKGGRGDVESGGQIGGGKKYRGDGKE